MKLAALALTAPAVLGQAQPPEPVSYHRDVAPLLEARCTGCHRPGKKKGKLDLTTHEAILKGGREGPALVAGRPEASRLVTLVQGDDPEMPAKGDPLTSAQIATLARWIEQGAKLDAPVARRPTTGPRPAHPTPPPIPALAYSPDGRILAVAGYHEILLHDGRGHGLTARLVGGMVRIASLAFSPDGRRLAAAGGTPGRRGEVQVWDVERRALLYSYTPATDTLYGVSFSPDGQRLAFGCADKAVRVLRIADGEQLLHFKSHAEWVLATCFTPDGKQLISAGRDAAMKIIDLADGRFVDDINNPLEPILALARHPKERAIVYAGGAGTPRIYRISDNQKRTSARRDTNLVRALERQRGPVHAVAYTSDGTRIAAGGLDPAVRVHDAKTGEVLLRLTGHAGPVFALAFHPDGRSLVTGGFDGILRRFSAADGELLAAAPPVPKTATTPQLITALRTTPGRLELTHGRDERRVLVTGVAQDGTTVDLTGMARLRALGPTVTIGSDGYVIPAAVGTGEVLITAGGLATHIPVDVRATAVEPVHFARDVMPVLAKAGCNAGTCHGAQAGQNGFVLSLRGFDPRGDYGALVHDLAGRRIDRVTPTQSLLLQKPVGTVPHEGQKVLDEGSRHYQILLDWITQGSTFRDDAASRVARLQVLPARIDLAKAGESQRLIVLAHYEDGSVADVTREANVSVSNVEVARVDRAGRAHVTALRRGESAVLIRYEGRYETAPMTVMGDRSGFAWRAVPQHNFIDEHVDEKLQRIRALPSELCTDSEFVRRLYLDLTGKPPTPEAARAFLASEGTQRQRRDRLIDALIGSPAFVDHWANKWADLLQCNSKTLGAKGVWVFRRWIAQAIAQNTPYDRFVRELITARGGTHRAPAANYMRTLSDRGRAPDTGKMTEDITQTFLGIRFSCNKCHNHPFERWTQTQYYEVAANFARVRFKKGREPGEMVVYDSYSGGETQHPKTKDRVAPAVPFGTIQDAAERRRHAFAEWLTAQDNPYFARSYVNRVWSYFFGIGIIEPVDDIRASNPPSNPELLDALEREFIASGFDFRALVRTICRSHTWQRSFRTNRWNADDRHNFSHCVPRRLSAEQLVDALAIATGVPTRLQGLPEGSRPVQAADGIVQGDDFLALFGRPERDSACECARTSNLSLAHALNLVSGETIHASIIDPRCRIQRMLAAGATDAAIVTELYWATLARAPTTKELAALGDLGADPARLATAQDLLWALTNSPAFLFNR